MVKLDIDVKKGGMKLDDQFLVDFGADKDDILLAHEMRWQIFRNLLCRLNGKETRDIAISTLLI